jgi:pyruvate/2-oxoglutarate/acetoin dehydrogenase E1 component
MCYYYPGQTPNFEEGRYLAPVSNCFCRSHAQQVMDYRGKVAAGEDTLSDDSDTKAEKQAAEIAASEGTSIEVIDIRSLSPIDFDTIVNSVKKTGRLIVAHEASTFVSISSEIAARVAEKAFYHLEAPVLRVGGFDVPYPAAKLEEVFLPDADRILEAVDRVLSY